MTPLSPGGQKHPDQSPRLQYYCTYTGAKRGAKRGLRGGVSSYLEALVGAHELEHRLVEDDRPQHGGPRDVNEDGRPKDVHRDAVVHHHAPPLVHHPHAHPVLAVGVGHREARGVLRPDVLPQVPARRHLKRNGKHHVGVKRVLRGIKRYLPAATFVQCKAPRGGKESIKSTTWGGGIDSEDPRTSEREY
eukprot:1176274-Prorocentrum_minimum.AAC.6